MACLGIEVHCARPMSEPTDDALLQAWGDGDARAGEVLVTRHLESVHRFFSNKVRGSTDDLVQQTFLACLEAAKRFQGTASFRAYLFGIARNLLHQHYRGRSRDFDPLTSSAHVMLVDQRSPADAMAEHEEQRLLLRGLQLLPLELQTLVELAYWESLSDRELAEVLELPVGTVKSRLRKARKELDGLLGKVSNDPALLGSSRHTLNSWAERAGLGFAPDESGTRR